MLELTNHKVNGLNEALTIEVEDEPGPAGAHHLYSISWPGGETWIRFQYGPVKEGRPSGLTNEALLAIVEHRLACFQSGSFACGANQTALEAVQLAMATLKARTTERLSRGVEGTHAV